ncbi:hypothetical protein MAPG_08528 [Magnaporthiopsis poae ATCC 64411]|uniref:DUF7708 domain-containing protein n=1 Tax=Magnaporthiopsis poae (strain ATCC 64411 / 73-15) TaxID=644358 RepID=A0A0C4E7L4_MAGP6|nr:hypothetical protein MAPG_08528 [Magnaporthiopsis poae ATCC 64411]
MSDLTLVSQYLSGNKAGTWAEALANPDPAVLQQARALYIAHRGRLPTPPLPEPLQPSQTLCVFLVNFSTGMQSFLQRTDDKEAAEAFGSPSWEQLQEDITSALKAQDNHDKRRRDWRHNPIEAADKMGGVVARRIECLLELVPDGDYTSVLVGGLRLLCNTAKRKKEVRGKILEVLASLSETISHTKAEIRLYTQNQELRDKSEALYMAILDFVQAAAAYLNKASAVESFKAFFQQDRYGSSLDSGADKIEEASVSFERSVSVCFQSRVQRVDKNTEHLSRDLEALRHPIVAIYSLFMGFVKDFPSIMLEQLMRQTNASRSLHLAQPSYNVSQPVLSSQQLFQFLCTSWNASGPWTTHALLPTIQADLQAAKGFIPSPQQESRIGLLMIEDSFNTWLRSPSSRLLIVHDEKALESDASLSTTSYLCALMCELLSAPGMLRLGFFCGLHSSAATAAQPGAQLLQGAVGLMRSLTLQLLLSLGGDGNTSFPLQGGHDPNQMLQGLATNDLETMCTVFAMLLWCMPAGAVYVLVDGAFWYGTEARRDDMRTVMLFLDVMVGELDAASRGVALKVLVTNPTPRQRSSWVPSRAVDIYLEQGPLAGGLGRDASRMLTGM